MECEICGAAGADRRVIIEGAILTTCSACSKLGCEVKKIKISPIKEDIVIIGDELIPELPRKLKAVREARGLTREALAKKLLEKKSVIDRIEQGKLVPDIELARKLEKVLKTRLIVRHAKD